VYRYTPHRPLPSFPTRRSSDLEHARLRVERGVGFAELPDYERARRDQREAIEAERAVERTQPLGARTHRLGELAARQDGPDDARSEEHTSELQSRSDLVCRLLL